MKIKRFEAKNVNGYLNFNISFNDSLTFLIGINGSGKTTAIKLILGLLSPSWINLTQIKYQFAEVECSLEDEKFIIRSEHYDSDKIKLSISYSNDESKNTSSTIRVQDLSISEVNDFNRFEVRQALNRYSRHESNFTELEAVKKIRELSTPTFLGLDRRIHEGGEIDLLSIEAFMRGRDFTTDIKGNLYESLLDIEKLVKSNFLEYSQKQSYISESLKNKIIYSSFDIIHGYEDSKFPLNTDIDIKSKKKKIIEASKNFDIAGVEHKIIEYFNELSRLQASIKKEKNKSEKKSSREFMKSTVLWFINSPQLQRIDNIISLYENAQKEIEDSYKEFIKFENLAELYFNDNNKRLKIKKNGEIQIELPNQDNTSIFRLSSGEKQIIVMLAQLIFGRKRQIFIIDEPELSLHLEWQEIFVKSLIEASPNTQFIMATHSPTIIGSISNQEFCQDLTQLNTSIA